MTHSMVSTEKLQKQDLEAANLDPLSKSLVMQLRGFLNKLGDEPTKENVAAACNISNQVYKFMRLKLDAWKAGMK